MLKKEILNLVYLIFIILLAVLFVSSLPGCATENKSVGLGGAIGAGAGAIAGGLADPGKDGEFRTRNVFVGTALGGMAGMIAGAAIHGEIEGQKKEAYLKGRASAPTQKSGVMPALKSAKVDSRWIEGHAVGNRYIEGHFEYVIAEPTKWDDSQ